MEKKLVCPNCGEPFEIDEKGYAAIAKQVRDKEFKEELTRQQASLEAEKRTALELAKSQTAESYEKQLAAKEAEILKLKARSEQAEKQQELAVARAEAALKEQMQEKIQRQQAELTGIESPDGAHEKTGRTGGEASCTAGKNLEGKPGCAAEAAAGELRSAAEAAGAVHERAIRGRASASGKSR